ncbi:hypothetical protein KY345_05945 [Candidatus Woesearchaeota archaeon]|nr:hypothetical protein [Candidatus Woesearchaeota archaeon]
MADEGENTIQDFDAAMFAYKKEDRNVHNLHRQNLYIDVPAKKEYIESLIKKGAVKITEKLKAFFTIGKRRDVPLTVSLTDLFDCDVSFESDEERETDGKINPDFYSGKSSRLVVNIKNIKLDFAFGLENEQSPWLVQFEKRYVFYCDNSFDSLDERFNFRDGADKDQIDSVIRTALKEFVLDKMGSTFQRYRPGTVKDNFDYSVKRVAEPHFDKKVNPASDSLTDVIYKHELSAEEKKKISEIFGTELAYHRVQLSDFELTNFIPGIIKESNAEESSYLAGIYGILEVQLKERFDKMVRKIKTANKEDYSTLKDIRGRNSVTGRLVRFINKAKREDYEKLKDKRESIMGNLVRLKLDDEGKIVESEDGSLYMGKELYGEYIKFFYGAEQDIVDEFFSKNLVFSDAFGSYRSLFRNRLNDYKPELERIAAGILSKTGSDELLDNAAETKKKKSKIGEPWIHKIAVIAACAVLAGGPIIHKFKDMAIDTKLQQYREEIQQIQQMERGYTDSIAYKAKEDAGKIDTIKTAEKPEIKEEYRKPLPAAKKVPATAKPEYKAAEQSETAAEEVDSALFRADTAAPVYEKAGTIIYGPVPKTDSSEALLDTAAARDTSKIYVYFPETDSVEARSSDTAATHPDSAFAADSAISDSLVPKDTLMIEGESKTEPLDTLVKKPDSSFAADTQSQILKKPAIPDTLLPRDTIPSY